MIRALSLLGLTLALLSSAPASAVAQYRGAPMMGPRHHAAALAGRGGTHQVIPPTRNMAGTDGRAFGATIAAAGGSLIGLIAGVALAYDSNPMGLLLTSTTMSWGGAALGGAAVGGNGAGAAKGSLIGIGAGILAGAAVSGAMGSDSGATPLFTYALVHGLITAVKASN